MELMLSHINCPNTTPRVGVYVGQFKTVAHDAIAVGVSVELECATCGVRVALDVETPKEDML